MTSLGELKLGCASEAVPGQREGVSEFTGRWWEILQILENGDTAGLGSALIEGASETLHCLHALGSHRTDIQIWGKQTPSARGSTFPR